MLMMLSARCCAASSRAKGGLCMLHDQTYAYPGAALRHRKWPREARKLAPVCASLGEWVHR